MAKETKRTQLGIVIDARMKERGITAEQLADAVGVDICGILPGRAQGTPTAVRAAA